MYRVATIKDLVRVPPNFFAMDIKEAIKQLLREKYERKIDRDLGVILSIDNVRDISIGKVIAGDGASYHWVTFDALVFMPEVNEIVEGEITEVVEFGVFMRMGPLEGLIHLSQITNDFLSYDKKIPAFIGKESNRIIRKGDTVIAKISTVSLKSSIPETKIGLTMRPEGLGKHDWIAEQKEQKPKEKKSGKKAEEVKE
ncbi:MAG: DNA-directed RNA polymerase [Candidatus Micrarchaeia archaeon]